MSEVTLYRWATVAGVLSSVILLINVLRRAGAVPTNALTHAISPFAAVLALFALTGLYLWQRSTTGWLGLLGYVLSTAGFAGAVGTEVVVQFVFAHLPTAQVDALVAGPSRPAFVTIALIFTAGALLFGTAMLRSGQVPRLAAAGYLVSMAVFAWRTVLPELVVTVDGIVATAVVVWLSVTLRRAFAPDSTARPMVRR